MHTTGYGARLTGKPPPLCPVALVIGMRALVCHTPAVITLGSEDNIPISVQFIGCIHHTRKTGFAVPLCVQKWASATHSEQHKRLSQYTKAFSKLQVMPIGAMPYSSIACVCVRTQCLCQCVCCMWGMRVLAYLCTCGGQKLTVVSSFVTLLFCETGNLEVTLLVKLICQQTTVFSSLCLGFLFLLRVPKFLHGCWRLSSVLYTCAASSSLIEHLSDPYHPLLFH